MTGRLPIAGLAICLTLLAAGAAALLVLPGSAAIAHLVLIVSFTGACFLLAASMLVRRSRAVEARRAQQLGVLQQAAKRMSARLAPGDVGRAVIEEVGRVVDYHNARVYLFEPPEDLVAVAFDGTVGAYESVDLEILRSYVGQGFTGWVAQHRTPLYVPDAAADPRGATIPGTQEVDESMLVVPMLHDDLLVGVITLTKLGLDQFDEEDQRLLTILADQAATAFTSASHLADAERLTMELRRLLEMSSALSRSLDPHAVANLLALHLARAVGAERAQVSDWDAAHDRLRTLGCHPAEMLERFDAYYPLDEYPQTRRVLNQLTLEVVDAEDPDGDPAEAALLRAEGNRGLIMLPLVAHGEAIGLVELVFAGRATDDAARITLARTMAHEGAMALANARLYETARNLADRDPLTGFFNHRYLHQRMAEEVVRAVRTRRPLSMIMLDLDDFKLVNDTFGHTFGDQVLVHVAELIRASLRGSDVAARYGGDEFAVILPETDAAEAVIVAERILDAIAQQPCPAGRREIPIAASIGIATHPQDARTAAELVAAADQGLYGAKSAGGNVVHSGARRPAGAFLDALPLRGGRRSAGPG
jgi:diguanylate cyclase (GGDEF)-like protein